MMEKVVPTCFFGDNKRKYLCSYVCMPCSYKERLGLESQKKE